MPITVNAARTVPDGVDALAVGIPRGEGFDDAVRAAGADPDFARAEGFEGKPAELCSVPGTRGGTTYLVGLGAPEAIDLEVLRRASGAVARAAWRHAALAVELTAVAPDTLAAAALAGAVAEGVLLGSYRYVAHKSEPLACALATVTVVGSTGKRVDAALARAAVVAGATNRARDLVNEPGGSLTPERLAAEAVAWGEEAGFSVQVWDRRRIEAERLGGLLGVNRGSSLEPRFLLVSHEPERARGTVALVGKGITFDSGGLSIKSAEGMIGMKGDMGGAAAVLGAVAAAARLELRTRVLGFVPVTDNMTGPDATRVGDVLTIRNGRTVEVLNTDAEGRLILADGLSLATEAGPDAIVDLATLTGACMVALGERTAGLMGNHPGWTDQVVAAAAAAGEPVWPLPLPAHLRAKLDSEVADMKNVGDRYGGALTAGLFLAEFVGEGLPWVHLDIAGPSYASEPDGELPRHGTGFGVRTLVALLDGFRRPARSS